jgi:hypothetical protein
MRKKAPEDMTDNEYEDLKHEIRTTNPYNRCTCNNWNNEDGICSYCDWEEENSQDKGEDE